MKKILLYVLCAAVTCAITAICYTQFFAPVYLEDGVRDYKPMFVSKKDYLDDKITFDENMAVKCVRNMAKYIYYFDEVEVLDVKKYWEDDKYIDVSFIYPDALDDAANVIRFSKEDGRVIGYVNYWKGWD